MLAPNVRRNTVSNTNILFDLIHSKSVLEREGMCFQPSDYIMSQGLTSMEELAYALLASLPRSSLANIQKKIVPLLQLDVVGVRLLFLIHASSNLTPFYISYSPPRSPCISFPISHPRPSYTVAWSADAGALSLTITPSGNDYAQPKGGFGRILLHNSIFNPTTPNPCSMIPTTREWVMKRLKRLPTTTTIPWTTLALRQSPETSWRKHGSLLRVFQGSKLSPDRRLVRHTARDHTSRVGVANLACTTHLLRPL
jgi:hypothetical protein